MTIPLNLKGRKFGRLTIIRRVKNRGRSRAWLCLCDCGKKKVITTNSLTQNNTRSCGCIRIGKGHWRFQDLMGRKFGRLIVIEQSENKGKNISWRCKCDCGNQTIVTATHLRSEHTQSCGCLRLEATSLPEGQSAFNTIYRAYKKRRQGFNIPEEQFKVLINSNCYYCGKPPSNFLSEHISKLNGSLVYNGLDRVDNSRNYITDNVVPCCADCNRAKRKMTHDEFINMCIRICRLHSK